MGSGNEANMDLWEAAIDGTRSHVLFPEIPLKTSFGDWTANGKLFFFFRREGNANQLWVRRESKLPLGLGGSRPTLLYSGPLEIQAPVSSRDSKELYVIGSLPRAELSVYDSTTSQVVPFLNGIQASFVTFSPDRQWIAYTSYPDGALWKSRIDGSEKTQLTFAPMVALLPRWSPDGKFIVFMEWDASEYHSVYIVPSAGGQPRLLVTKATGANDPTWSPDGMSIAYGGTAGQPSEIDILDMRTMGSNRIPDSQNYYSPRWSPDGKYIAALTNSLESKMVLYSFAEQKWRSISAGQGLDYPAWSHDSRFVYATRGPNVVRIDVERDTVDLVANLENVNLTAFIHLLGWFDLTPDDRIMTMRNTSTQDIYALQLEY